LPAAEPEATHLITLDVEEAFKIVALIRDMIPVLSVFFELGHEGASIGSRGLVAFRLVDILRHVRLDNVEQVETCLRIINDAARHVRDDADAAFYGVDNRGYCLIAEETQRSIGRVWQETIAHHDRELADAGGSTEETRSEPVGALSPYPVWTARARPMAGRVQARMGHAAELSRG
jgi:hypothetical protein